MLKFFLLGAGLLLSSCMVGPNYKEPKTPVMERWLSDNKTIQAKPINDSAWWEVFRDPTLTYLIHEGYRSNLSLQKAGVHVLQSRAQLAQSVGSLYPQTQAMTGNYAYERLGGTSLESLLPQTFDMASLGFTANWELDFWGKYRRAIRSKDAVFLSSVAAYDNALVSLTADIASSYINLRTQQRLIKVTQENINIQAMGLKLARARYQSGQTSLLDVEQAQAELSETQASLPRYQAALQMQKNALAVLLGRTPDGIDALLTHNQSIPQAPLHAAVGIPKEALAKRPDIHQARLVAMAQLESIGAVKANLYPSLALAGTFAFSSTNIPPSSISDMFDWSSRSISAGGGLNWPLLNYGQITNAVRAQDAVFQQALLDYQQRILEAQREVQDSITQFIQTNKAKNYLTEANRAALSSTRLAMIRYKEGESDFTPVLDAERQQVRVQSELTKVQGDVPKALVALYRALGGGWQIRQGKDVVANEIKKEMASRTSWGSLLEQRQHMPPASRQEQLKQLYLPNW